MERTQEKTVAENHEGESVKGLSKWEVEARRLAGESATIEEDLKEGGHVKPELNEVLQNIAHLKEEQAKYLLRIHEAMEKIDEKEAHNQSALELRKEVEGMEGWIKGLKKDVAEQEALLVGENKVESGEIAWAETAPKLMTYAEAVEWAASLANDGVEYVIPTIDHLEQAHVDQVKGFNKENPYLSSTESTEDINPEDRNHWAFNFEDGKRVSIGKAYAIAVRVVKI